MKFCFYCVILKFSDAKLENIFQCHNDKND